MKNITSRLLLAACALILFFLLTSAFKQPSAVNEYLTVRTFEAGMGGNSKIMIIYENGKTEELELEKYRVDNLLPNAIKINQALNKIGNKGYELVSQSGGEYTSLYTFVKK